MTRCRATPIAIKSYKVLYHLVPLRELVCAEYDGRYKQVIDMPGTDPVLWNQWHDRLSTKQERDVTIDFPITLNQHIRLYLHPVLQ
jgi:hypothetical protein